MLTIYRSNRAEFLAQLLAQQLLEQQPGPLETIEVLVNTWPTSRWLGEQLAQANGISSLIRFPFPGSRLRQLVRQVLDCPADEDDPWRANRLVWAVLDQLPALLERREGAPLQHWLRQRGDQGPNLSRDRWQLARTIADAFDDYALYRPDTLRQWAQGLETDPDDWQPILWRSLANSLTSDPFGLQVHQAIDRLRQDHINTTLLPQRLRLFGISALAPVQVSLVQALSGHLDVEIYLLTPCPDLWQRCGSRREQLGADWMVPPDGHWLQSAPRLEATLGRMGAEFQQLLEGSGESQLGARRDGDLFAGPIAMADAAGRPATLLEQLQHHLVEGDAHSPLQRHADDRSLLFLAAPGPLREVQLVRDQVLQWLHADPTLAPRDVLVMTPQIERYAPLLSSVFNDSSAIGIDLPWRLTDRSQQSSPGLSMALLQLLELAAGRLTATALDQLLANPALQTLQGLGEDDAREITQALQRSGFRWGLDRRERQGDDVHSLLWCLDRWLLGLVLPQRNGLVAEGAAPFHQELSPDQLARWWPVLNRLSRWLQRLRQPHTVERWVDLLRELLDDLFGDGDRWSNELQALTSALDDWQQRAGSTTLQLDAAVVINILDEALSVDSGRFGHRSGSLTISALEPMRAIPHRVIVLMGLDANDFPRQTERPGFHLLEQHRQLGDPRGSDQDRYVLLEALMSSRQHLLISWCGRHERTGEEQPPAAPVEQWLTELQTQLGEQAKGLRLDPPANPLDRRNFLTHHGVAPFSCDRRQLAARTCLDQGRPTPSDGLAWPLSKSVSPGPTTDAVLGFDGLLAWLQNPQGAWLQQLGLHTGESIEPIQDLESVQLNALERHLLLNAELDDDLIREQAPDWTQRLAGQGLLPSGAGALMEDDGLRERWTGLHRAVCSLGPCHRRAVTLANQTHTVLIAGDTHVVVQPGKLSHRAVMRAWLLHLLLSAHTSTISGTAVIARSLRGSGAESHLRWPPLDSTEAIERLGELQGLAACGLRHCWPVPPRSGWQLAWQEQRKPGSGAAAFRLSWEEEQRQPALQLCFGSRRHPDAFLEDPWFIEASTALYAPLLTHG